MDAMSRPLVETPEEERALSNAESLNQQNTEKNANSNGSPHDQLTPEANRAESSGVGLDAKGDAVDDQSRQASSQEVTPTQGDELNSASQQQLLDNNNNNNNANNNPDESNINNETNIDGLVAQETTNGDEEEEELLVGLEGDESNVPLDPSLNQADELTAVEATETDETTATTAALEGDESAEQKESLDDNNIESIELGAPAPQATTAAASSSPTKTKKDSLSSDKTVAKKRKPKPKRFADGNLILEEEDDENERVGSSIGQIHQMDPIGQMLDDSEKQDRDHRGHRGHDMDMPTSPDKMMDKSTLDDDYQEVETDLKPTREELLAKYQAAIEERDRLQNANNALHHKLGDYLRKKKSDDVAAPLFDKSTQDQEQRYMKYLGTIESLRKQLERNRFESELEMDDIKLKCELKENYVEKDRGEFVRVKRDTGVHSVSAQTGRPLTLKEVEFYLERQASKEREVIGVRIENIRLKNQLAKREHELKSREEFGDGLHMIDFEQLKIENQTYNEKIEERNEELMKLKKKLNNTVQILSHVKEKLKFVNDENEKEKVNLSVNDELVKKNRDRLNKMKQSRDSLRMDNVKLKQNSGLLGNVALLRDFEESVDKNEELENRIEHLKRKHAELFLNSNGFKQKIAQAKNHMS